MTARRLIAILVSVNAALIVAGWAFVATPAHRATSGLRVGLVFDIGGKNDKSFNESAWRGLQRARDELGVEVSYIEPTEGADRESALRVMAARGFDLVIGVGYLFGADLERLAAQFPNVKFAGIDYTPSPNVGTIDNLVGLRFREHEGSFLVGAIAGLVTRSKTVGFVGGMKIPLIRKFEAGFEAGVKHVCPSCRVRGLYATGFADPAQGGALAAALYDSQDADIIFHAAGTTGDGVFAAARQRKALAIGVDSDQHDNAPCCVLTSMIKRVDVAVLDVVKELLAKRFRGGLRELGLAEDGVGFIADERNRALLPRAVVDQANKFRAQIVAGTIRVPDR